MTENQGKTGVRSATAGAPEHGGAARPVGRKAPARASKALLGRARWATLGISLAAFVASLVGVVQASPAALARPGQVQAPSMPAQPARPQLGSSQAAAPLVLPPVPQAPSPSQASRVVPRVRSRGS